MRCWDIASGEEVSQENGSKEKEVSQVAGSKFVLTARKPACVTLLIEDGAAPVACFKAPQYITGSHCQGATICVECDGGAVCILQAPFLAV